MGPHIPFMKAKMLGYRGENIAADYLHNKGYEIIKTNFTVRGGEIDIIAKKNSILVFVEVKTRSSENYGYGNETVNNLKKSRISRAINRYLDSKKFARDPDYRLDIIDIQLNQFDKSLKSIQHFEDVEL